MSVVDRKLVISNTVFVGIASVVAMLISLFILPLFVKNLGADIYGIWIVSGIILGYLGLLDFGFAQGLTRYVADARVKKDYDRLSGTVISGSILLLCMGLMVGTIIILFRTQIVDFFEIETAHRHTASALLLVTGLFSIVSWPLRITRIILQATLRIKEQSILNAVTNILSSSVMLLLVYRSVDIVSISIIRGFLGIVLWIPSLVMVLKYVPEIRWNLLLFSFSRIREMSSFSLGMFYAALLSMLTVRLDNLVIGKMISMTAVTYYAVSAKLFHFMGQWTRIICSTVVPTVYNLSAAADKDRITKLVYQGIKYRTMINAPLAFLCIIVSPSFIRIWMGPEYEQYAIWSQLFLLVPLLVPLGIMPNVLKGMGKVGTVNVFFTIKVLLNVLISISLVSRFGIGGPILGTLISMIVLGGPVIFPYLCTKAEIEWKSTFKLYIKILLLNFSIAAVLYLFVGKYKPKAWLDLLFVVIVIVFIQALVNSIFFVRNQEIKDMRTAIDSIGIMTLLRRNR
ncbi:MAG: oligosaccharide flippase family protein [Desulfobacteraceae bacterium]|nr:oligosaccharide flippase family protein [Desulfobacteraceae bacterium]